jgi:hypothetical protein
MLTFKSIANFNCQDPHPGVALDAIYPLSQRAHTLMVRNSSKPCLQVGFMNIIGAVEMLGGLEYHHDNVVKLSGLLAAGAAIDETNLYHEAVAYVNRLGQFHYFAMSKLVSQVVDDLPARIPTIQQYLPFRMKHSAHRSLDSPHSETESAQILQAMSLSRAVGRMMTLKPCAPDILPHQAILDAGGIARFRQLQWQNSYVTFQLFDEDANAHLNLILEKEHPAISSEAYDLLASVILWDPNQPTCVDSPTDNS